MGCHRNDAIPAGKPRGALIEPQAQLVAGADRGVSDVG